MADTIALWKLRRTLNDNVKQPWLLGTPLTVYVQFIMKIWKEYLTLNNSTTFTSVS